MHSGDDLASAAERVLGFRKRSRKRKEVVVERITELASSEFVALLEAAAAAPPAASTAGAEDGADAAAAREAAKPEVGDGSCHWRVAQARRRSKSPGRGAAGHAVL